MRFQQRFSIRKTRRLWCNVLNYIRFYVPTGLELLQTRVI